MTMTLYEIIDMVIILVALIAAGILTAAVILLIDRYDQHRRQDR